ncbi:hypothetical protein Ddye_030296 [Dipteronia dyeriana]|uniref:Uncharacterized protein n=1 Tax=Dipteronia dyeriana TaxID=168575 RepID=A0AAD9WLC5_9ROSI|nr:hypothetical protein Ddye_030296 [Dipteronia dyeriana]
MSLLLAGAAKEAADHLVIFPSASTSFKDSVLIALRLGAMLDQVSSMFKVALAGFIDAPVDGLQHGMNKRYQKIIVMATKLDLTSLRMFTRAMEKVAVKMVEMLASAVGFENPIPRDKPVMSGGFYPYIVSLQCQIRQQKYSLSMDSCRVTVRRQWIQFWLRLVMWLRLVST